MIEKLKKHFRKIQAFCKVRSQHRNLPDNRAPKLEMHITEFQDRNMEVGYEVCLLFQCINIPRKKHMKQK